MGADYGAIYVHCADVEQVYMPLMCSAPWARERLTRLPPSLIELTRGRMAVGTFEMEVSCPEE